MAEYKSSFWQKLKNFFSRFIVYQMIIIWLYMKFSDLDKSTNDFKTRTMKTLNHFNINGAFVNFIMDDPSLIHILLVLSELVSLIGALFGSTLFSWMLACHFTYTTFIFFNPFLPENSFTFWKFDMRFDMLTSFAAMLCFYMIAYFPYDNVIETHIIEDITIEEKDDEDEKVSKNQKKKKLKTK